MNCILFWYVWWRFESKNIVFVISVLPAPEFKFPINGVVENLLSVQVLSCHVSSLDVA